MSACTLKFGYVFENSVMVKERQQQFMLEPQVYFGRSRTFQAYLSEVNARDPVQKTKH